MLGFTSSSAAHGGHWASAAPLPGIAGAAGAGAGTGGSSSPRTPSLGGGGGGGGGAATPLASSRAVRMMEPTMSPLPAPISRTHGLDYPPGTPSFAPATLSGASSNTEEAKQQQQHVPLLPLTSLTFSDTEPETAAAERMERALSGYQAPENSEEIQAAAPSDPEEMIQQQALLQQQEIDAAALAAAVAAVQNVPEEEYTESPLFRRASIFAPTAAALAALPPQEQEQERDEQEQASDAPPSVAPVEVPSEPAEVVVPDVAAASDTTTAALSPGASPADLGSDAATAFAVATPVLTGAAAEEAPKKSPLEDTHAGGVQDAAAFVAPALVMPSVAPPTPASTSAAPAPTAAAAAACEFDPLLSPPSPCLPGIDRPNSFSAALPPCSFLPLSRAHCFDKDRCRIFLVPKSGTRYEFCTIQCII